MPDDFQYDVFLSHSSKDNAVVRDVADRLRKDGVKVWFDEWEIRPGDSTPAKIEEGLAHSRVLLLFMSGNAFGSDWAQLESGTFRFRDPLNKERRFLPLRLDDTPIKGSLAQLPYIDWAPIFCRQNYVRLFEACKPLERLTLANTASPSYSETIIDLGFKAEIPIYKFSPDGTKALISVDDFKFGPYPEKSKPVLRTSWRKWLYRPANSNEDFVSSRDNSIRLWDIESRLCLRTLEGHRNMVTDIAWNHDLGHAISSSFDNTIRLWDVEAGSCLRVFKVKSGYATNVEWVPTQRMFLSGGSDGPLCLWDLDKSRCIKVVKGHSKVVTCLAVGSNGGYVLSGSSDNSVRLWDLRSMQCVQEFSGHTGRVRSVTFVSNYRVLSASNDRTLRLWDITTGRCLRVLEGHEAFLNTVAWNADAKLAISGAVDGTVRLWDIDGGRCMADLKRNGGYVMGVTFDTGGRRAISGHLEGRIQMWDLTDPVTGAGRPIASLPALPLALDQVEYTNAKVLILGEPNAGKTGLAHRLATGNWKPSEDSTVGAWSTQWQLKDTSTGRYIDREIWLWDFGGQADQRLIHQLFMDRTALILLLFNADQEDVLPGLRDWLTALRRCVNGEIPHFLVAGRIDTGFRASRGKLQVFAAEQGLAYYETSAKSGESCDELRDAITAGIPWEQMEKRTSPRIFKLIKDEVLMLRDEGQVLHTFKELRELLWRRLPEEPRFTDETLQTVIDLLVGPGAVKELDFGTYILLAPEWINAYAQAVIRTLRTSDHDLGVLPLRSIAEGKLIYQSIGRDGVPVEMKRLPPSEERVVLGEMERQLEQRGLCLRQGDKLVFPSHCGRDRPAVLMHPSVFLCYAVKGFLDDIYATLVVKIADSKSFTLKELWRDAADFVTLAGDHHMGIKLTRETASDGDISVYFGKGVTQQEQVIFANYIHGHLEGTCENALRLRHYVCPHCHTAKGNPEVLMKKLLAKKHGADTECDGCGARFPLWDTLEKKFASDAVRRQVEELQAGDLAKLDTRRRGKLLALEVGARITSANQKCFEIPATEDEGLDMELEFTNDDGEGTGHRLYLQLKSGNSHLTKRKTDGADIFTIKKQRWVEYWIQQPHPVMLVIGTFSKEDKRVFGNDKLEFADVRWMEISSVLKRESANGTKPVKQIEFKGERLDLSSVRRWRDRFMVSTPS